MHSESTWKIASDGELLQATEVVRRGWFFIHQLFVRMISGFEPVGHDITVCVIVCLHVCSPGLGGAAVQLCVQRPYKQ
ncbi:unnamed protein product [Rodentolepis nana]|uniref:Uncharacterized protein n=1 Tax=Rodentolepis nana TaxID=102285 RepID=A0A0R3TGR3_RODNA|nr:unnamed protein product [Rodentolepis nana]